MREEPFLVRGPRQPSIHLLSRLYGAPSSLPYPIRVRVRVKFELYGGHPASRIDGIDRVFDGVGASEPGSSQNLTDLEGGGGRPSQYIVNSSVTSFF